MTAPNPTRPYEEKAALVDQLVSRGGLERGVLETMPKLELKKMLEELETDDPQKMLEELETDDPLSMDFGLPVPTAPRGGKPPEATHPLLEEEPARVEVEEEKPPASPPAQHPGLVCRLQRKARKWQQKDLAQWAEVKTHRLSAYERELLMLEDDERARLEAVLEGPEPERKEASSKKAKVAAPAPGRQVDVLEKVGEAFAADQADAWESRALCDDLEAAKAWVLAHGSPGVNYSYRLDQIDEIEMQRTLVPAVTAVTA